MKKNLPLIRLLLFVVLSFFVLLLFSKDIAAQEGGFSLRVSPPILEIEIEPGESYSDFIKFTNLSEFDTVTLYPQVLSFRALGEEGGQEFIEDDDESITFSLAQWINISVNILEIEPLERIVLPFTITVPEDAEPGGRYAAILLSSQPDFSLDEANQVTLGAKSGSILLVRIAGESIESAIIKEFKTSTDIHNYPPVDFEVKIENRGNVHVKPLGRIEINNMFGKKVGEVEVNNSGGNVLPESIRKFDTEWERDEFTIGKFTAVLSVNYGESSDKYVTSTISFWVLPIREIIIALAVLVVLIVIIIMLVKSYRRAVEKKALEMQNKNTANIGGGTHSAPSSTVSSVPNNPAQQPTSTVPPQNVHMNQPTEPNPIQQPPTQGVS